MRENENKKHKHDGKESKLDEFPSKAILTIRLCSRLWNPSPSSLSIVRLRQVRIVLWRFLPRPPSPSPNLHFGFLRYAPFFDQKVFDDSFDGVGTNIDGPSESSDRIVYDGSTGVTFRFESETCYGAC